MPKWIDRPIAFGGKKFDPAIAPMTLGQYTSYSTVTPCTCRGTGTPRVQLLFKSSTRSFLRRNKFSALSMISVGWTRSIM